MYSSNYGQARIHKGLRKGKLASLSSVLRVLIATGVISLSQSVWAWPVWVGGRIPMTKAESYTLQIATDWEFQSVLEERVVRQVPFLFDAPEEAVFHWRLIHHGSGNPTSIEPSSIEPSSIEPSSIEPLGARGRGADQVPPGFESLSLKSAGGMPVGGQPGHSTERNTFVSGSVAVIGPLADLGSGHRYLYWQPTQGIGSYQLRISETGGMSRVQQLSDAFTIVRRRIGSQALEVVLSSPGNSPKGKYRLDKSFKMKPSTQTGDSVPQSSVSQSPREVADGDSAAPFIEVGNDAASQVKTPDPLAANPKPQRSQALEAPQPPQVAPTQTSEESASAKPLVGSSLPQHRFKLSAGYLSERFEAGKLEAQLKSTKGGPIVGLDLASNPIAGLVVHGSVDYFRHQTDVPYRDGEVSRIYNIDNSRVTSHLIIGWDLLAALPGGAHELTIGVGGAGVLLPRFPKQYNGAPSNLPGLHHYFLPLMSGRVSYYGVLGSNKSKGVQLGADLIYMQDEAGEVRVFEQRLGLGWRLPTKGAGRHHTIGFRVKARRTSLSSCHQELELCQQEGQVRSDSVERSIALQYGFMLH